MKIKKSLNVRIFLIAIFPVMLVLNGCSDSGNNPLNFNLFTLDDDRQLGEQLAGEIASNPQEYPLLEDAQIDNYLENILSDILASPEIEYENDFNYNIQVINRDVINAFAAPGGYIYIYTGLLKFLDNEATLSAIIAHEVAHVERRHATQRMTTQLGVNVLLDVILGDDPSTLETIGANLLTGLGYLQNSRSDEYEADEYSFNYLKSTIWYPGAGIFFFDKVKSNEGSSIFDELLSTHPMPQDRIDALQKLIDEANLNEPTESNLFSSRYSDFKKMVP